MKDLIISRIKDGYDKLPTKVSIVESLELIRQPTWAPQVTEIRKRYEAAGGGQPGKDAVGKLKLALPGLLFSGIFDHRKNELVKEKTGLLCADLDHLGDSVGAIKEQVCADPHTLACFVSPTGTGLKVIVKIDPTKDHIESFHAAQRFFLEQFGLEIDKACNEVARVCFVSHDPELFVADDAKQIPYPPPITEYKPSPQQYTNGTGDAPGNDYNERGDWQSVLLKHGWIKIGSNGWRRPEKTYGLSATWDKVANYPKTFFSFTSSTPLPANEVIYPFAIYTFLECGGDFSRAAKQLAAQGYGRKRDNRLPLERMIEESRPDKVDAKPDPFASEIDAREVTIASQPVEPVTRLFLANKPVCTPGNITTIISRAKTGKTATIGAMIASIVAAHFDRSGLDTFGFTAPHTKEAIVLIDTEQAIYDAFICHQRALARAQQPNDLSLICHYALVGFPVDKLKKALVYVLEKAKRAHGGIFMLILDGIADFVNSVNDEAECNQLVAWVREISVTYNCPVICVIHSNEGVKTGDDGRGHLGKQLTRKAESNLLLKKTGEVTVVTSEKQRKAPITEADGVAFTWSDEVGRHVACGKPENVKKNGRPSLYNFEMYHAIFQNAMHRGLTFPAAYNFAYSKNKISDASFRRIVKDAVQDGTLFEFFESGQTMYKLTNLPS